jgi:hypothetical protein
MIITAYFKAQYFLRDTEEDHKKPQSGNQFLAEA